MRLERSLACISQDRNRDFALHVFLEGGIENVVTRSALKRNASAAGKLLVLDLNQPVRMDRQARRMILKKCAMRCSFLSGRSNTRAG
jgi:hypothetical protein